MMVTMMVVMIVMTKMTMILVMIMMMTLILRERSDSHYLTVEARDERGRGNRNTVELVIRFCNLYPSICPQNNYDFPRPSFRHCP